MNTRHLAPVFASILSVCAFAADGETETAFTPLFDGSSLAGWHKVGGTGEYHVEDDSIVGIGKNAKPNTFLISDRTYRNFDLRFSFRNEVGNSGVMFRALQKPGENGRVFGYQCEQDHRPQRAWTGGLYDEARRKWLQPHSTDPRGQAAFTEEGKTLIKWDDWNDVRILCVNESIKIWLNGKLRVDFIDTDETNYTPEGFLGLQVHAGEACSVRWRDLRIEELE
jgi:hypothetical protein